MACALLAGSGCASMRAAHPNRDLQPCTDGFAVTADGWHLGIRRYRPAYPDPGKLPVVLSHGLGLNGTFWTITDHHLPSQLAERGYEVFVVDMRGSGASHRVGPVGRVNQLLRETPLLEWDEGRWNVDDQSFYDVPAILNYVRDVTGSDRVNWIGHSLGGMLMFPYLELGQEPDRIAAFVGMGATITLAAAPQQEMLRANRGLRALLRIVSTGRMARPMMLARPPGMGRIDKFYFTVENVDRRTVSRFYGSTLENPGRGALKQLDPYLEFGHMVSANGKVDYVSLLNTVKTPTLMVAGEADIMSDIPSTYQTYNRICTTDKAILRFGKRDGQIADYGHCDLVWSRYAPVEVFPPIIDWLDNHQPGVALSSPQSVPWVDRGLGGLGRTRHEQSVDANLRPGLELAPQSRQPADIDELRPRQP